MLPRATAAFLGCVKEIPGVVRGHGSVSRGAPPLCLPLNH